MYVKDIQCTYGYANEEREVLRMFTFRNVGKEMCFWARLVLVLLTISWFSALGIALIIFWNMVPDNIHVLLIIAAVMAFIVGYGVIRLSVIRFYAEGKSVYYLASIDEKLDQLCKMNLVSNADAAAASKAVRSAVREVAPPEVKRTPERAAAPETKRAPEYAAVPEVKKAPEKVAPPKGFCSNCGVQNPAGSMFCTNCGTPLK